MAFNQPGGAPLMARINFDRTAPVKLACQNCRAGHQKCDGCLPVCSRCKKEQKACDYTPSRRGRSFAHLQKKKIKSLRSHNIGDIAQDFQPQALTSHPDSLEETSTWSSNSLLVEAFVIPVDQEQALLAPGDINAAKNDLEVNPHYLSSFYIYFWPAHPFLPPYKYFLDHDKGAGDARLLSALHFIGSKFSRAVVNQPAVLETAQSFIQSSRDGYSVQTLILLAISHHMSNDRETAKIAFSYAVDIALSIGLDNENFATDHSNGEPLIEESWRRTWWELYILDAMFAALNQESSTRLEGLHLGVLLPCEEALYRGNSVLPKPQSLNDFDSRFFNDDNIIYSSFTYRIAAARILNKIISAAKTAEMPAPLSKKEVELELENLILHLPKNLEICIDSDGVVNEVAFQAHMMMYAATIYLHRPQSLLVSPGLDYSIVCTPNSSRVHTQPAHHHTRTAVNAANEICRLVTASPALVTHTPFFICALAMQAIVHLGIYSVPTWAYNRKLAEEQIKMSIGALRKMGEVWEIANTVRQDVKKVAKALLETSKRSELPIVEDTVNRGTGSLSSPNPTSAEEGIPLSIEAKSQSNDDSWIDEFLAVNALH